jgi:hypothetical protein
LNALARFQDAFGAALFASDAAGAVPRAIDGLARQPGFAVYRNTVVRGLVDAIVANHPAVARLVGDEWLRGAAGDYVRAHPPRDAPLLAYGADFDAFLESFAPAVDLPWLPAIARLDRMWREAHGARDDATLDAPVIATLDPAALADAALVPHAAARWAWSDTIPIHALWSRNRADGADLSDVAWRGEGALLTRPAHDVRWREVDRAACAFLDACAEGRRVADAVDAALAADARADLARLMATLLDAGAFGRLDASPTAL